MSDIFKQFSKNSYSTFNNSYAESKDDVEDQFLKNIKQKSTAATELMRKGFTNISSTVSTVVGRSTTTHTPFIMKKPPTQVVEPYLTGTKQSYQSHGYDQAEVSFAAKFRQGLNNLGKQVFLLIFLFYIYIFVLFFSAYDFDILFYLSLIGYTLLIIFIGIAFGFLLRKLYKVVKNRMNRKLQKRIGLEMHTFVSPHESARNSGGGNVGERGREVGGQKGGGKGERRGNGEKESKMEKMITYLNRSNSDPPIIRPPGLLKRFIRVDIHPDPPPQEKIEVKENKREVEIEENKGEENKGEENKAETAKEQKNSSVEEEEKDIDDKEKENKQI